MTLIDPVTTSTALTAESELPTEETVAATAVATQAATVAATTPDLSSLESMVADVQTQLAADPQGTSVMGKIVGILAGVVSALVSLVSNLLGKQDSSSAKSGESTSGVATPSSTAKSSATTTASASSSGTTTAASSSPKSSAAASQGASSPTSSVKQSHFDVMQNDQGAITVRTTDGYLIRAEAKDHAWSITGPDGMTTRIWGDPHVSESDGGAWDFKNRGTFFFGKNKVTVEVVPFGNGQTISSAITLYSGDERVTIKGLDTNKPMITAVSHDGKQHDDSLADGDAYSRAVNKTGEAWRTKTGSKTVTMGAK
jgi:hypothetical protein